MGSRPSSLAEERRDRNGRTFLLPLDHWSLARLAESRAALRDIDGDTRGHHAASHTPSTLNVADINHLFHLLVPGGRWFTGPASSTIGLLRQLICRDPATSPEPSPHEVIGWLAATEGISGAMRISQTPLLKTFRKVE